MVSTAVAYFYLGDGRQAYSAADFKGTRKGVGTAGKQAKDDHGETHSGKGIGIDLDVECGVSVNSNERKLAVNQSSRRVKGKQGMQRDHLAAQDEAIVQ